MAVPNRKTLAKYFAELQKIEEHRSAELEKNIRSLYRELLKELQQFLGVEYANYAEDDRLTYSALAKKNEYARFLEEVQKKVNDISPKVSAEIIETVKEMYRTAYEGMINAVAKSVNDKELSEKLRGIYLTQPQVIKAAVNNPVSKLTLSKTLEKNRKKIVYNIKQTVTVGIMNGDTMSSMANKIKNDVNQNYRKAMLIARTEVHRVRETGHNSAADSVDSTLKTAGSDYRMVKTWKSKQDIKVRRTDKANHVKLHGQTVLQDEDFDLGDGVKAPCPGQSGVAAHDCNCRCRISRDLLNDQEFFRLTGRHFPENSVVSKSKKAAKSVDNLGESGIIRDERIIQAVRDGKITLILNPEKQNVHIIGTKEYNPSNNKSYFNITINELQDIINQKHGTGEIRIKPNGQIKETIVVSKDIGNVISKTGENLGTTNRMTIHYSMNRTHIVPSERKNTDETNN